MRKRDMGTIRLRSFSNSSNNSKRCMGMGMMSMRASQACRHRRHRMGTLHLVRWVPRVWLWIYLYIRCWGLDLRMGMGSRFNSIRRLHSSRSMLRCRVLCSSSSNSNRGRLHVRRSKNRSLRFKFLNSSSDGRDLRLRLLRSVRKYRCRRWIHHPVYRWECRCPRYRLNIINDSSSSSSSHSCKRNRRTAGSAQSHLRGKTSRGGAVRVRMSLERVVVAAVEDVDGLPVPGWALEEG